MTAAPSTSERQHNRTDHAPVLFCWETSFRDHGINTDPDMTAVGHLLRSAMEKCTPCMQEWATIVAKDTQNRPAVVHLLGSSYTWAGQRNGKILEELVSEHVYGPESQKILTAMRDGAVREMLRIAEEMTPTEVWDVIDDALAAATYRPDTTH